MKSKWLVMAGIVVASAGLVLAEGEQQEQKKGDRAKAKAEWLKKYDADGDGVLSEAEKEAAKKAELIAKYDKDGDGVLSDEEKAAMEAAAAARREAGKARMAEMMKKYDKDGDGKLSDEEKAAMKADMEQHKAQRGEGAKKQ